MKLAFSKIVIHHGQLRCECSNECYSIVTKCMLTKTSYDIIDGQGINIPYFIDIKMAYIK